MRLVHAISQRHLVEQLPTAPLSLLLPCEFGRGHVILFLKAAYEMREVAIARLQARLGHVCTVLQKSGGVAQTAVGQVFGKTHFGITGKQRGKIGHGNVELGGHRLQGQRLLKALLYDLGSGADQRHAVVVKRGVCGAFLMPFWGISGYFYIFFDIPKFRHIIFYMPIIRHIIFYMSMF